VPRAQSPRTQRKKAEPATTRAFLFSDLRDYTSFVEAKGDAAAARLLRDYRTLVRREVARHDGAEVKTEGDSFYVVFEAPSVALDCAVAILRAADTRDRRDPTAPLRIGVGVHAGETIAYDDQFVGSAVNIASRLAGKASAGELLISDTLRGLVRTSRSIPMTERGPLELKGVAEPIRAWTVDWNEPEPAAAKESAPAPAREPIAAPSGQFLCPVVVGRAAESARFVDALLAAKAAKGQTVVLGGEAGVGKSAFVRRAQEQATTNGFRMLLGLTHQSDAGLPYAPFISAVRSGFRGLDRDELGRVLQRSAPDLAQLFPELGRLGRAEATTGIERHRLAVAFQHLFRAFARESPVLLVLEDLHWADEASLELLRHLARELRDARIAILATYRSDEMHRRHPLLRALSELQRERVTTEISLKRLTADETKEVIRATFAQRDPNVNISDEFRDAIHARSEGNPFFTEELLKAVVESGGVYFDAQTGWQRKPIDELEIPGSIREAVRARIDRLSDDARQTLAAASVMGQRFAFDVLRAVRGTDDATLEAHVRQLIDEQLANEVDGGRDEYAFRHALTREVVYDDLLVRERKRLHRGVAEALVTARATEPALLAHHLLAAGEQERAVPVLIEAADRAARASAPREAAAHYAKAIEIGLPEAELAPIVERQAEEYLSFDTALSIKAAEEALALYAQLGDRRGRSRMLRLVGRGHFYEGRHDVAESRAREAVDVLEGEECIEMARAVAGLAGLIMARTEMAESIPVAERAIEMGERLGDPWTLSNALITRGSAVRGHAGLPFLRRGLEVALKHGIHEAAQRGYNNTLIALIVTGASASERRAFLTEGLEYARRHGIEQATVTYELSHKQALEFGAGDWDGALATGAQMHQASAVYRWAIMTRASIAMARETPEAALPIFAEFAARGGDAPSRVSDLAALAYGAAHAGQRDEALAHLEALESLISRYPGGGGGLDTPRSLIGGPLQFIMLATALVLDQPRWVDMVEQEIRNDIALAAGARHDVAAARALLARDATACAREIEAAYPLYEHVGFFGQSLMFVVSCVLAASKRGLELDVEWRPIASRTRAFAERAGAKWWLKVLEEAGL
jgi:class 3 adenylate cyclase/tetratricopeptide (TPR) repeat protein